MSKIVWRGEGAELGGAGGGRGYRVRSWSASASARAKQNTAVAYIIFKCRYLTLFPREGAVQTSHGRADGPLRSPALHVAKAVEQCAHAAVIQLQLFGHEWKPSPFVAGHISDDQEGHATLRPSHRRPAPVECVDLPVRARHKPLGTGPQEGKAPVQGGPWRKDEANTTCSL